MTIYYVDPIDGNNSNDGLTFANRKKTLKSVITNNSANEIRVIESNGGLVSSNTTWTTHANHRPRLISSATNLNGGGANLGWQINLYSHGFVVGDFVYLWAINTSTINGYWEVTDVLDADNFVIPCYVDINSATNSQRYCFKITNQLVKLDTPKTKNIALNIRGSYPGDGNHIVQTWDRSTTYTTAYNYEPANMSYDCLTQARTLRWYIHSYFSTGRAIWKSFPTPLDLTGFRQLSFYFIQTSGNTSSTPHVSIRLCSDTQGQVSEYEFPIHATSRRNFWCGVTVDCANLPAGQTMTTPIQSIAFYVDTDRGSADYRFQNIIACKGIDEPDCLTHTSVISTKRDNDMWWPVLYVDEDQVVIGGSDIEVQTMNSANNQSPRSTGYWYMGGTFSPSTYSYSPPVSNEMARETGLNCYVYNAPDTYSIERGQHRLPYTSSDQYGFYFNGKSNWTISGGWNRTDMSTRDPDALSWFHVPRGAGSCLFTNQCHNTTVKNCGFFGGDYGIAYNGCRSAQFENIHLAGSRRGFYFYGATEGVHIKDSNTVCSYYGIYTSIASNSRITNLKDASRYSAFYLSNSFDIGITSCVARHNTQEFIEPGNSYQINMNKINVDSINYFTFTSSEYRNIRVSNLDAKNITGLIKTPKSTSNPQTYKYEFHNINQDYTNTWNSPNYHYEPHPTGGEISPWTKQSQVNYNGYDDPMALFGYKDGSFASASYGLEIVNSSDTHTAPGAMKVSWTGGGTQIRDVYDVAVTDVSQNQFAGGRSNKVLLGEFSVVSSGTATITVQCKRTAYDNDHINGNLYVARGSALNAEVRSASMTTFDQWEELSVDVNPTTAGIVRLYLEVRGFFGTQSNQPMRGIIVDTITVNQS
tara:strand:- start:3539 stop:6145 length:2607 start_codon:yes stop_codon:yes gene_type:complete